MKNRNPFRQKLRKRKVPFHKVIRIANESGKDSSAGNTDLAIDDNFLWLSYDFSVPLVWIAGVEPVGPGFSVTWDNVLSGESEVGYFCVRKTFGYNEKLRDEIVQRIRKACSEAAGRPVPDIISSAGVITSCEACGELDVWPFDYRWVITFLMIFVTKPDRRVLCGRHARIRLVTNCLSNLTIGSFGIGLFISPLATLATTNQMAASGVLSPAARWSFITVAFIPYAVVAWAVVASLWAAFNF